MSFTKIFPYNTGTFVIVNTNEVDPGIPKTLLGHVGSIACYQCVDEDDNDDMIVFVSGYKDSWGGEYLLKDIRIATDLEINTYKKLMGIE